MWYLNVGGDEVSLAVPLLWKRLQVLVKNILIRFKQDFLYL